MRKGRYYIGYCYEGESMDYIDRYLSTGIENYETALKIAKEQHKAEIKYCREELGYNAKDEIASTYVIYIDTEDGNEYEMAKISGWRSKLQEWVYE